MKFKILVAALMSFGLWSPGLNLHAQGVVATVTISVSATVQNSISDDGTNTAFTSVRATRRTVDLLKILASDEFAAGNYANTNFPVGAKLVISNGVFQVVSKTNSLLVDVSNILSITGSSNQVQTGKSNDSNGLGSPTITTLQIGGIIFDDTAIIGGQNLQFNLQGLVKLTQTDVVNTKNGTYAETFSALLSSGTGEGTSNGDPFVLTGTLAATGKGTLPIPIVPTHLGK